MTEYIEKGWVQGKLAAFPNGKEASVYDPEATRFCLTGALDRTIFEYGPRTTDYYTYKAIRAIDHALTNMFHYDGLITRFNDEKGRTQQEVLAVLHEAQRLIQEGDIV
jgi:hypothetical protein